MLERTYTHDPDLDLNLISPQLEEALKAKNTPFEYLLRVVARSGLIDMLKPWAESIILRCTSQCRFRIRGRSLSKAEHTDSMPVESEKLACCDSTHDASQPEHGGLTHG